MQAISRIPALQEQTFGAAQQWFATMQKAELLFHPDDDPQDIVAVATNKQVFTAVEVTAVREIMEQLFETLGDDVYEACYPLVMGALRSDAN
jgi:hypothetical protein